MLVLRRIAVENRDAKYPQDTDNILKKSLEDFVKTTEKILDENEAPDYVFVSPFASARRCVETLDDSYRILYDPEIGKHITSRKSLLQKETEDLLPVFDSNMEDFKNRIAHRFRRLAQIGSSKVIWVITHQDVMKEILTAQKSKDIPKEIPVTYVVSMSCTLSRVANPQQQRTIPSTTSRESKQKQKSKEKEKRGPKVEVLCRKCKKEECICDAIYASLEGFCQRCHKDPCICVKRVCMDCMKFPCECDSNESSEDPFSAY